MLSVVPPTISLMYGFLRFRNMSSSLFIVRVKYSETSPHRIPSSMYAGIFCMWK